MRQVFAFISHKRFAGEIQPRKIYGSQTYGGDALLDETCFHALKIARVFYTV